MIICGHMMKIMEKQDSYNKRALKEWGGKGRMKKEMQTVDAVPVVRCKDCKYHEDEEIGMVYCPNAFGGWVRENWFCADGKWKEGADNS